MEHEAALQVKEEEIRATQEALRKAINLAVHQAGTTSIETPVASPLVADDPIGALRWQATKYQRAREDLRAAWVEAHSEHATTEVVARRALALIFDKFGADQNLLDEYDQLEEQAVLVHPDAMLVSTAPFYTS